MDNLSSFNYKRRCSIFKNELETKQADLEDEEEKMEQWPNKMIVSCGDRSKSKTKSSNTSMKPVPSKRCQSINDTNKFASKCLNVYDEDYEVTDGETILGESASYRKDDTTYRLEVLKDVFKDAYSEEKLLDAVSDPGGMEHGVSVLLSSPIKKKKQKGHKERQNADKKCFKSSTLTPSKGKKRSASDEAFSCDLPECETPSKQRKILNHLEVQSVNSNSSSPVQCIDDGDYLLIDDLQKMKELFPDYKDEELQDVLESNGFCLDDAVAAMEAFCSPQKKEYGQTEKTAGSRKKLDMIVIDDNSNSNQASGPCDQAVMTSDTSEEELAMYSDDKADVLSFLDSAELAEIALVRGCSMTKAEKICNLRPFNNWSDLIRKIQDTRGLNDELLQECSSFMNERNKMEVLMDKCETISKDIQGLFDVEKSELENPSGIEETRSILVTKEQYITREPSIIAPGFKLKHYQLCGLNWLIAIHKKGVNGILADEMGLGKTIQAIVFLAHLIEQGERGPHLITVPSSTCDNWKRELEQWCPSVGYLHYTGSQGERRELRDKVLQETEHDFQIMIATYNLATSSPADRSFLRKVRFHYAIFDEAHMLKNMKSQRYQALMRIQPRRMLLLTGTPIQNNLLELMSLLTFLMPEIFAERVEGIKLLFGDNKVKHKEETAYHKEKVAQAKKIMQPFVMRRVKKDVLGQLPTKHDHVIKCELPTQQRKIYDDAYASCYKLISSGQPVGRNGGTLIMQLRQAADHPLLHRNYYNDDKLSEMARRYCKDSSHRDSDVNLVFEDMQVMSDFELSRLCLQERNLKDFELPSNLVMDCGKYIYLDTVLPDMKRRGDRVLLFNQFTMMMDITEVYLQTRNYKYLRLDGSTLVADRQNLIDKFNTEEDIFIFLLSTRAGGQGINLTSANVVILYDSDYNPHNDKQAEDRCHRLGQTREVNVYRLICKDTIEEAILKCAQDKIRLHEDISGNKNSESEDIQGLLKAVFGRH